MHPLLIAPLLAAHLVCVNVASAGPLVCLWFEWREGRGDVLSGRAGRFLAAASLALLVVGSAMGLLIAAMLWSDEYRDILMVKLKSRVSYGVWEWVFSAVLMAAHVGWWRIAPQTGGLARTARAFLPLLAGTNLLYHFPPLFVIVASLSAAPESPVVEIRSAEFRAMLMHGTVAATTSHFVLASFAMCGIALLGYARRLARLGDSDENVRRVTALGGRIALAPTLLQIPVGLWMMTQLPASSQQALLGGDIVAVSLFGAALLAAFALMHHLSAAAMGDTNRKVTLRAVWLMGLVVVLMTVVLQQVK